jgi:hypothetical protein
MKEFLDALHRGKYTLYSVIPACRVTSATRRGENPSGVMRYTQYSKAKKDSGQAGMTS